MRTVSLGSIRPLTIALGLSSQKGPFDILLPEQGYICDVMHPARRSSQLFSQLSTSVQSTMHPISQLVMRQVVALSQDSVQLPWGQSSSQTSVSMQPTMQLGPLQSTSQISAPLQSAVHVLSQSRSQEDPALQS